MHKKSKRLSEKQSTEYNKKAGCIGGFIALGISLLIWVIIWLMIYFGY